MLARHLVSAQSTDLPDFDPREVYLFLTRDNVELRKRMLEHLKVCCLCWRALAAGRSLSVALKGLIRAGRRI